MGVAIIGTGNVAYHLVRGFLRAGVQVDMVYGRSEEKLSLFRERFAVPVSTDFSQHTKADLFFIAVSDSAIADVASRFRGKSLVHTAGAVDIDVLSFYTERFGVFYPFQTFRQEYDIDWPKVPIFLESCCRDFDQVLKHIAGQLSADVHFLSTEKRRYLHLSGVLVNNFVNHLLYQSKRLLEENGLKFEWVIPLLEQTLDNVKHFDPYDIQTGPARRGDFISMNNHQDLLAQNQMLREIYNVLSHSILELYSQDKGKKLE